jgi:uridine kinase
MTGAASNSGDELAQVLGRIRAQCCARKPPGRMRTRVIAVDGPGGAGKSTFAKHLATALDCCQIVHTDDFASWERPLDWWPELIQKVLDPLADGQTSRFERSRWTPSVAREQVEVVPGEFLILEGVTASREAFRPYLTYAIWIEANHDARLRRGLERDGETARPQWQKWIADEDEYRQRERADERADLVLSGELDLWN